MSTPRTYGWRKDVPDRRDFQRRYLAAHLAPPLPPAVDLRPQCPPIYDQGQLGSCTANAIAAAIQFDQVKQGRPGWVPSRLFIYYNERLLEKTVTSDSGAQIRDGFKTIAKQGVCPESLWPYVESRFAQHPPIQCYKQALAERAVIYARLPGNDLHQMKSALAAGFPFAFGFSVYESFESDEVSRTGIAPMPKAGEQLLGGHAVLGVGYNDTLESFIVRNSWGDGWGMSGYFVMPYAYLSKPNLSSDFWTVQRVS